MYMRQLGHMTQDDHQIKMWRYFKFHVNISRLFVDIMHSYFSRYHLSNRAFYQSEGLISG